MIHFTIHPVNPQERFLSQTVEVLKHEGGICVYPTDTVYGIGSCAGNSKALEKIRQLLHKDKTRLFSYICSDFSQISTYARMSNSDFKLMKRYLPGPYTFLLNATNYVPKKVCPKRRVVGIRLPDCQVCIDLVTMLNEPLANTSLRIPGENRGNPYDIKPAILNEVDIFLDAGELHDPTSSTVIDLTSGEPVLVREGKGHWDG